MMINKRLIGMVPNAKRYVIRKVAANWISLLAAIVLWFSVAHILDTALAGRLALEQAAPFFLACGVCIALRFALARLITRYTHEASASVKGVLRDALYGKLRRLGGSYVDAMPTAEVVQLAGEGVEQLETYFGGYLPQFFYAMLAPVTLLIVFWPLSPLTALVLFICVPLIPAAIIAVQKIAKRLLGKYWDAYANLGDTFLENLQGLTTLKVYGADEARHKKMNDDAELFRKATMRVLTMQLNSITIMDLVAYGGTAAGSILAARTFALGQVSFGGAIAMVLLDSEFFLSMRALGSFFHVAMNGMSACDRIFRLLDLPEHAMGIADAKDGDICMQDVHFSYDGEKPTLRGISLTIPKGGFVAFCGASGCGKSTLASLLSGGRTGYEGSASIGGTELRDVEIKRLLDLVTVVSSGSYLFAGTVRSTLLEGKPDATEKELIAALQKTELIDFIFAHGGLNMPIAERGSNLSGGQRQRLALARALLKDSPIYIFDEATSNIDAESEEKIMDAIRSLRGRHTVVIISHRLANVTDCDTIFYLEQGALVERGSHAVLMAKQGGYADMYFAQREMEDFRKEETKCVVQV